MYPYVKRVFDFTCALTILVVFSLLMIIVAVCIKLDSPGPVFFKQERAGIHKEPFTIYKFRTMSIESPKNVPTAKLVNPEQHITKVGQFIRKRSIDELPQLFNIIKGEMSIVGPRPIIFAEAKLIEERERLGVYEVLPGVTGLAQISGRDLVGIYEKAQLDSEYAKKQSFLYDVKILMSTVAYVLKMHGVIEGVMNLPDYTDHLEPFEEPEPFETSDVPNRENIYEITDIVEPLDPVEFYEQVEAFKIINKIENLQVTEAPENLEWVEQVDKRDKVD